MMQNNMGLEVPIPDKLSEALSGAMTALSHVHDSPMADVFNGEWRTVSPGGHIWCCLGGAYMHYCPQIKADLSTTASIENFTYRSQLVLRAINCLRLGIVDRAIEYYILARDKTGSLNVSSYRTHNKPCWPVKNRQVHQMAKDYDLWCRDMSNLQRELVHAKL